MKYFYFITLIQVNYVEGRLQKGVTYTNRKGYKDFILFVIFLISLFIINCCCKVGIKNLEGFANPPKFLFTQFSGYYLYWHTKFIFQCQAIHIL